MKDNNHQSFIHDIQIASPCKAEWNFMTGDEQKRYCHECKLNVYNISAMTLPEAEELIISSEGKVCVRMYRRTDGTVITKDCPVGFAAKLRARAAKVSAGVAAIIALVLGWRGNVTSAANPEPTCGLRAMQGQMIERAPRVTATSITQGAIMPPHPRTEVCVTLHRWVN